MTVPLLAGFRFEGMKVPARNRGMKGWCPGSVGAYVLHAPSGPSKVRVVVSSSDLGARAFERAPLSVSVILK
jgi:hypothetical protein